MASSNSATLSERDRAEGIRREEEARRFAVVSFNRSEIQRYLSPSHDTPYPLEYAYYLLGDVRAKTVLDLGCGKGNAARQPRGTAASRRVGRCGLLHPSNSSSGYSSGLFRDVPHSEEGRLCRVIGTDSVFALV